MHPFLQVMLMGSACTAPEPLALLEPAALAPVPAAQDPLADHRPDPVDCPEAAWGEEDGAFEVQTGVCNYAAFDQPLPARLLPGDEIALTVWHDQLDAAEPATGHVALLLGELLLWEAEVQIPAESDELQAVVPLEQELAEDAPLGLHLHNHGYNSWRFVAVDLHPG